MLDLEVVHLTRIRAAHPEGARRADGRPPPGRREVDGVDAGRDRTLTSTNPCESMIECVRRTSRNVKRWSSGEMALRWTAAGMLEAERQFRRVIGYRDLAKLCVAIESDISSGTITASNSPLALWPCREWQRRATALLAYHDPAHRNQAYRPLRKVRRRDAFWWTCDTIAGSWKGDGPYRMAELASEAAFLMRSATAAGCEE
jgi:hypothetical protein